LPPDPILPILPELGRDAEAGDDVTEDEALADGDEMRADDDSGREEERVDFGDTSSKETEEEAVGEILADEDPGSEEVEMETEAEGEEAEDGLRDASMKRSDKEVCVGKKGAEILFPTEPDLRFKGGVGLKKPAHRSGAGAGEGGATMDIRLPPSATAPPTIVTG